MQSHSVIDDLKNLLHIRRRRFGVHDDAAVLGGSPPSVFLVFTC
jgi:hypothetical protein